jgi:hypothetical protein
MPAHFVAGRTLYLRRVRGDVINIATYDQHVQVCYDVLHA